MTDIDSNLDFVMTDIQFMIKHKRASQENARKKKILVDASMDLRALNNFYNAKKTKFEKQDRFKTREFIKDLTREIDADFAKLDIESLEMMDNQAEEILKDLKRKY